VSISAGEAQGAGWGNKHWQQRQEAEELHERGSPHKHTLLRERSGKGKGEEEKRSEIEVGKTFKFILQVILKSIPISSLHSPFIQKKLLHLR
jgi:hypothetical protein